MAQKKFIYAIYTSNDNLIGVYDSIREIIEKHYNLSPGMDGYNSKLISLCSYIRKYANNDKVKHYKWKIYKIEKEY